MNLVGTVVACYTFTALLRAVAHVTSGPDANATAATDAGPYSTAAGGTTDDRADDFFDDDDDDDDDDGDGDGGTDATPTLAGRPTDAAAPPPPWTESTWYVNARALASGCSVAAIVFAVIVYAGVLGPRAYGNFARHHAFWLLVTATLTLTDDLNVTRDLDPFGYLKLFTICVTNNLQMMMSCEFYCFLKSVLQMHSYYCQMFKDNFRNHALCCGWAITVTGICFLIEENCKHIWKSFIDYKNIKILNIFYLFPVLINLCVNLVVFYYTFNLKARSKCNNPQDIFKKYHEKLLIRKQLFGLVGTLWLVEVTCVTAQFFGMNYSVLQDLKTIQGMGTFIILVFKRSIMDQIKIWILAHTNGKRPNVLPLDTPQKVIYHRRAIPKHNRRHPYIKVHRYCQFTSESRTKRVR